MLLVVPSRSMQKKNRITSRQVIAKHPFVTVISDESYRTAMYNGKQREGIRAAMN